MVDFRGIDVAKTKKGKPSKSRPRGRPRSPQRREAAVHAIKTDDLVCSENALKAFRMRIQGHTFNEIGQALGGVSRQRAHALFKQVVTWRTKKLTLEIDEYRDLELARIDEGVKTLMEIMRDSDDDNARIKAASALGRLIAARGRLLPIEVPRESRAEVTGAGGESLLPSIESIQAAIARGMSEG